MTIDTGGQTSVAVAVSGGADSMALTHMLVASGVSQIYALTFDHGLRLESSTEARQVGQWLSGIAPLTHHILTWGGDKPHTRILEKARQARYDAMGAFCEAHGLSSLYVAHHQDDQAETVLMRLAKGSGLDGLCGMSSEMDVGGLMIKRPLLNTPKSELLDYCARFNIPYVQDPSNQNENFLRPRLRAAQSILAEEGLTAKRLSLTAKRLARAREALDIMTDQFISDHVLGFQAGTSLLTIDLQALRAVPEEIALRVMMRALSCFRPDEDYAPRLERTEELTRDILSGMFKGATLGGCLFACGGKDQALLILRKEHRN
ncbi:MAG: tRNA lysidine(34) synthetase TilS [Alphaproteobacteria bacterium]|nr:tRNA lysidine(34) synthetase TilS [Alphaproteobacteria bacterium]